MEAEQEIKSLIRECVAYFREEGYSEPRIADYQRLWRNGIKEYMNKNSLVNYNAAIGEGFLGRIQGISDSYMCTIRRSVHVLSDLLSYGKVRKRITQYVFHELPGEIGKVAFKFIESQAKLRRSKPTLNRHQRILSYFINHLTLRSVNDVSDLSEDDVLTFISSVQNSKDGYLNTVRLFCRFLYEQRYIDRNVEYVIGRTQWVVAHHRDNGCSRRHLYRQRNQSLVNLRSVRVTIH